MADVFTRILRIELPDSLQCDESGKNPAFSIALRRRWSGPLPADYSAYARGQRLFAGEALEETVIGKRDYQYTARVSQPAALAR
jgi:hypothetical protein